VITGDLDRALATAISSAGTWRPAPPGTVCGIRTYVTTIAFWLARNHAGDLDPGSPGAIAAGLAARLSGLDWVEAAAVTGGGYLAVTVTADALAGLAVRITQAGSGCARSSALAGTDRTGPAVADLASAQTWEEARRRVHAAVAGRLAAAAGAHVRRKHDTERMASPCPAAPAAATPVAEAVAYAGTDAITYALARLLPRGPARVDARLAAAHHLGNPAYAVRYAHAHAASALRQAADLGLDRGEAAGFQPRLLAHPTEQALIHELSWLPEQVAGAARRARPDAFAHFLEGLARAYFDCQESCPAARPGMVVPVTAPPGGMGLPPEEQTAVQAGAARLWLAAAARTALRTGLGLLGVGAPDRL
jgi:arginyl-tRNA synthetase